MDMIKTDSQNCTNIANAIRDKANTEAQYKPSEMPSGVNEVYSKGFEEGKSSVPQFERYAKTITLKTLNVFGKSEAVLNLDSITHLYALCTLNAPQSESYEVTNTTVEHLTINTPVLITRCDDMLDCNNFCVDKTLKRVTLNFDTQKATRFQNMFHNLQTLEIIDGTPLDLSGVTVASYINSMFSGTFNLVEVRFKGEIKYNLVISSSPNLSDTTIQNIIEHLADLTGDTAQTLTLHSTAGNKLTEEQKAAITAKNWTLVY